MRQFPRVPPWLALCLLLVASLGSGPVRAHAEGALAVDRLVAVAVQPQGVRVRVVVDFAELPTGRELQRRAEEKDGYARARLAELTTGLSVWVGGARVALVVEEAIAVQRPGDGGLPTLLLQGALVGPLPVALGSEAKAVLEVRDEAERAGPGWRELRVLGEEGVRLEGVEPPAAWLQPGEAFPRLAASGPVRADTRVTARLSLGPAGTSDAASALGQQKIALPQQKISTEPGLSRLRAPDPLVALLRPVQGPWGLLLALLAALVLGAAHALTPGHGKAAIAATLASTQGTFGQAVLLGLSAALTHVFGVALLAVAALGVLQLSLPERLFPWLTVFAGAVVAFNGWLLLRSLVASPSGAHLHVHAHDAHLHAHTHEHPHGLLHLLRTRVGHAHVAGKDGLSQPRPDLKRLVLLGVSGGLLPCPSSLVVLLSAIALQRVSLGVALVLSFALGVAATLVAVGLLAVRAGAEVQRRPGLRVVSRWLPAVSGVAMLVLGVGVALSAWS